MLQIFKQVKQYTIFSMFNNKNLYIKITETTAKNTITGQVIVIDKNTKVIIY